MLATMSKQKPKTAKRRKGGNKQPREAFHMPPELHEALLRFVADARPETTKTAVIRLALEDFLKGRGYLPAAGEKGKTGG
jgi:hypothetical protein